MCLLVGEGGEGKACSWLGLILPLHGAGVGLGGDPVWPQEPSLHQGLCSWSKQSKLPSSQGAAPG